MIDPQLSSIQQRLRGSHKAVLMLRSTVQARAIQSGTVGCVTEKKPKQAVVVPQPPAFNAKLVALGRANYEEAGCSQCQGASGSGNGPSAIGLKDDWGDPIIPSDLTLKPFKKS